MNFTYGAYTSLIKSVLEHGYSIATYKNWQNFPKCAILRHDIDNDIEKALTLAEAEKTMWGGVKSTYFVLVTSDFYNIFSKKSEELLKRIIECGHDIGLHFDETRYPNITTPADAKSYIKEEAYLLSKITGKPVEAVSMHRPSQMMLDADLQIKGLINSYGKTYFKEFKYVSDSRRRWREPIEDIITSDDFKRLHILTHAFWYNDAEKSIHDSVREFVNGGNKQRYEGMRSNITDLHLIMPECEVK